ncbi:MAG: hypothetical protein HFH57_06125 [Lachnospiraceae bacterium]|nr:hypothetical protein [Lachnospiraceae bacterium]
MEELYEIMRDLLELEYDQQSLLHILNMLEHTYSKNPKKEAALVSNAAGYYLTNLQRELRAVIGRMDRYLAENAKKR